MLIPILRTDNHYDYVKDFILDNLIESKGIVKFKRITGWVTIGTDMIRRNKRISAYNGTDKKAVNASVIDNKDRRDIGGVALF
ncbi:MAG: hypothetical protein H7X83_04245 [Verrucomicrobia bacterium]|nr:hypothetical protein [Deltaproteobacteria bacterium]